MRDLLARLILAYAITSGAALEVATIALLFYVIA